MSILNGVIKSDPYMTDYLKKKQPLTAFPSVNTVSAFILIPEVFEGSCSRLYVLAPHSLPLGQSVRATFAINPRFDRQPPACMYHPRPHTLAL